MPFPANCPTWVNCDDSRKNLTTDMIIREMIIEDSNGCPTLRVEASVNAENSIPQESLVTSEMIVDDGTTEERTGFFAAYMAWKAANPTRKVIRETYIMAGDGLPGIIISHIA